MGKNILGEELGKGFHQRKDDGRYVARMTDRMGVRHERTFNSMKEAMFWHNEAVYADNHGHIVDGGNATLKILFETWIKHCSGLTYNTLRGYKQSYRTHIEPVLCEDTLIGRINPQHCQEVLDRMEGESLSHNTIKLARAVLKNMFEYAVNMEILNKNPITRMVKANGKDKVRKKAFSLEEQRIFLDGLVGSKFEYQFRLMFQTGLRIGELTALRWEDIDINGRQLIVSRTMFYCYGWRVNDPKTVKSRRSIPLSEEAVKILSEMQSKGQKGDFPDEKKKNSEWGNLIFLTAKGMPVGEMAYARELHRICSDLGINDHTPHDLRHTFATRCAEGGMRPEQLQKIMGHSSITTTMDIYVHVTKDSSLKAIDGVSGALNAEKIK